VHPRQSAHNHRFENQLSKQLMRVLFPNTRCYFIFPVAAVARVEKIRFFKNPIASKTRFHISLGHATVMCTATFFGAAPTEALVPATATLPFDTAAEYAYQDELLAPAPVVAGAAAAGAAAAEASKKDGAAATASHTQYALLEFDSPVIGRPDRSCPLLG
jgi:selenocysteine-specific elongation factor